jgi:hypothetical protein
VPAGKNTSNTSAVPFASSSDLRGPVLASCCGVREMLMASFPDRRDAIRATRIAAVMQHHIAHDRGVSHA